MEGAFWFSVDAVRVEKGNPFPFVVETDDGHIWVRIRVVNAGFHEITCEASLVSLSFNNKKQNIDTILIPGGAPIDAAQLILTRVVPAGSRQFFNLAEISPDSPNQLLIASYEYRKLKMEKLGPGIYRLRVAVYGKLCGQNSIDVTLEYGGGKEIKVR